MTEGIILLDKPPGQTSFQSLGFLKRCLGTRRIGHAGTLDKFAEGLLIVLAGRMTRLCPLATSLDKEYEAVMTFGRGTDTLDPEGAVTAEGPVPSRKELESVLPEFLGTLSQVPPLYSAVHVNGRRASEAARSGETVTLVPRTVRIDHLDLTDYRPPDAHFRISCTKGTYIRSLARDIAARLGTCAHVSRLRRTRIGGFSVEDAHAPEAFVASRDVLSPAAFFDAVPGLGRLTVRGEQAVPISRGIRLESSFFENAPAGEGIFGAFTPDRRLLAVIERTGSRMTYLATFPESARMITVGWDELLKRRAPLERPVRLTIGVFDGLHLGHRKLIGEITNGGPDFLSVVVTFARSPAMVRSPGEFPGSILSHAQKMERISTLGVDAAVVIDFSEEMSNLSGEAFVRLLSENLTIQRIVVGQNFRFGKKRISGTDDLKEMLSDTGIEVLVTEPVLRGGSMVSSSRIRDAIRAGDFAGAREMLSTSHAIDLREVGSRFPDGSGVRIPRAEIVQVLPPDGEYAVTSGSPAGYVPGTCRIDNESLTLCADNGGSAAMMVFP